MGEIKQKDFDRTLLRLDPLLGKVSAYIPTTLNKDKAQVEKNLTHNFLVMLISWLIIASRKFEKPVIINDDTGEPAYEITIKKI